VLAVLGVLVASLAHRRPSWRTRELWALAIAALTSGSSSSLE